MSIYTWLANNATYIGDDTWESGDYIFELLNNGRWDVYFFRGLILIDAEGSEVVDYLRGLE